MIVPEDRRRFLWTNTEGWIDFLPSQSNLTEDLSLQFAFELVWRTEKCLCPILDNQIEFLESILDGYLLSGKGGMNGSNYENQESETKSELDKEERKDMCHFLLLALMRYYREEGQIEKWDGMCGRARDRLREMSPEYKARFFYEQSLFSLFKLDLQEFKKKTLEWPIDDSLPFWSAKRATLLAEIGLLEDAGRILNNSLAEIRKRSNLRSITTDYSSVSQESFIMLLLHFLHVPLSMKSRETFQSLEADEGFTERRHALRQYKCDPWNELTSFSRAMERLPERVSNVTEKPSFDIGQRVRSHHFGNENYEAFAALKYLRFCEDAGLPHGNLGATKIAAGTLSRIGEVTPYWAMVSLVRSGDVKVVDSLFNRDSLAKKAPSLINSLVADYMEAMGTVISDFESRSHFDEGSFDSRLAQVVPEVLSRLCCKCSEDAKDQLFNFLLRVYRSDARKYYSGIRHLVERLLDSYSVRRRCELIPELLEFPVLSELKGREEKEFANPFLLLRLKRDWISFRPEIPNERLNKWVEGGNSDNASVRAWSLFTLYRLLDWGLLDDIQESRIAETFWSRTGEDGFPTDTAFPRQWFLSLPHTCQADQISQFKKYVLQAEFPIHGESSSFPIYQGLDPLCLSIRESNQDLEWANDELQSIINRLAVWWDTDKIHLASADSSGSILSLNDHIRRKLAELVDTLVSLTLAHREQTKEIGVQGILARLISEMSEYKLPMLRLECACLHLFPERRQDVVRRIKTGMTSSKRELVGDAFEAVRTMSDLVGAVEEGIEKEDFYGLLLHSGQIVQWRRAIGLPQATLTISKVLTDHPSAFTEELEDSINEGLQHILSITPSRRARCGNRRGWYGCVSEVGCKESICLFGIYLVPLLRTFGQNVPESHSRLEGYMSIGRRIF